MQSLAATLAQCTAAERWFVAFSGGLDSSVLLHLLVRWCESQAAPPALCALHVDHGLQEASSEWAGQCRRLGEQLGVPVRVLQGSVQPQGRGLEAAARDTRYALLAGQLAPGDVLFTAHHLDDQVETFFLRLMRGAGIAGLAAMPDERPLGAGRMLRPLLDHSRHQLRAYAGQHGLRWIEDPSNADTSLDRNYLRREVLPRLEARWPAYRRTVARAAGHLAAAQQQFAAEMPAAEPRVSVCGDPGLSLDSLRRSGPDAAHTLREWLRSLGLPAPDRAVQGEFLRQLREGGADAAPRLDTGAYRLQRYQDAVYLLPADTAAPTGDWTMRPGAPPLAIPAVGRVQLRPASHGFRLQPGEILSLRRRRGGERCRPLGRRGSTSLKQVLQEAGVPPWWRSRVPLLYLDGELLAIGGVGSCYSTRADGAREAEAPGDCWELCWEPDREAPAN